MKNLVDVLNKRSEYDTFIEEIPDVIQEISLAGYDGEDGDWHRIEWKQDIVFILARIRCSLQELVEMINSEKSRIRGWF